MALKYANNAKTTLNGAITDSATSIVVTDGSVFPSLGGGDYFYMTLEDVSLNREIVKVTARSTNTLTVVRAQNGTTARAFSNADKAEGRMVTGILDDLGALVGGVTPSAFFLTLVDDTTAGAFMTTLGLSANGQSLVTAADYSAMRTLLSLVPGTNIQAYDAGLAALAAFNTNGLLVQTADNTFVGRTLTGTANEVTVTNGDGVSGAPTISLPSSLTFTGKTVTGGTFSGITLSGTIAGSPTVSGSWTIATGGAANSTDLTIGNSQSIMKISGGDGSYAFIDSASWGVALRTQNTNRITVTNAGAIAFSAVPTVSGVNLVTTSSSDTLSNKTLSSPAFSGTATGGLDLVGNLTVSNTNSLVYSTGTGGYGAFYARGSGTNNAYLFLGNVTNSERARIYADNSRNLVMSVNDGTTNSLLINSNGITYLKSIAGTPLVLNSGDSTAVKIQLQNNGSLVGEIASSSSYPFYVNGSTGANKFLVDSSGNGTFIGGVTATTNLIIGTTANPRLYMYNNSGTSSSLILGSDSGEGWIGMFTNSTFAFYANSTRVGYFTTGGNLVLTQTTGKFQGPIIDHDRSGNARAGRIYYAASNNGWGEYMGTGGATSLGPFSYTAPTGTYVTSWAWRSVTETSSGYGWTWETTSSVGTAPTIIMELANSGTVGLKINGVINARTAAGTTTTGTLVAADANTRVTLTGGITVPNSVFTAGDMLVWHAGTSARTITRGSGVTMYVNGTNVASATLAANSIGGCYWSDASTCHLTGAIS